MLGAVGQLALMGLVVILILVIIQQQARIRRLKKSLLAWREDTLRGRKKLEHKEAEFSEIIEEMDKTIQHIDKELRRNWR